MAAEPQGPAYEAPGAPQTVEEPQADPAVQGAPDSAQGAVAPQEEPGPHDDVVQQVKAATEAAAINALAFGTGDPAQIDVQSLDMAMGAVLKGCQAIALLDPAAKPLAPADQLRGRLDANKALLQDHQHAEQMAVQRETARQREGRPQGPAKPQVVRVAGHTPTVTFTAPVSDRFAVGDTVKAYPASNWPVAQRPPAPGSTQVGSSAESAVVDATGTVSFTTLTEDTEYFLTKDGSGVYVRIRPDAALPGTQAVSVVGTVPVSGTVTANPPTSGTATTTSVAAATSSTQLVAANAARKGLTLTNDSTSNCTVKFGTGASSSSYAVPLQPGQYYELPVSAGIYTGALEAIWTTANGNMRVTEWQVPRFPVPAYGQGLLANRPTASVVGQGFRYFATDDNGGSEYLSDGTTWFLAGPKIELGNVVDTTSTAGLTGTSNRGDVTLSYTSRGRPELITCEFRALKDGTGGNLSAAIYDVTAAAFLNAASPPTGLQDTDAMLAAGSRTFRATGRVAAVAAGTVRNFRPGYIVSAGAFTMLSCIMRAVELQVARCDQGNAGFSGSEQFEVWRGRLAGTGQRGALWAHGRAASSLMGTGARADVRIALTARGMVAFASDYGSSTHWVNATALSRVGTAKALIQASPYSALSGPVVLCGQSMGSLLALLYTLASPSNVKAVAIGLPLVNFLGFYSENRGGFQSEISTARGGAPDSTADPQSRAAEYAALGIPTKLWASSDDTLTPLAEAQTFGAAIGATVVDMGAQGHAVYAGFAAEAAEFLASHP